MFESNQMCLGAKVGSGRFTLVKPLGRGGMGEVWLAQDERLHEPAALKFLPPEVRADAVALDDLRCETARSHRLSHPNIVRIHDLHEEPDGMAFIAMEYVDGPTLAGLRLEQPERVLSWEFLRLLVQQLCAALDYAHGEKVIHRDLKPANVMVDGKGRLKLADFGIAATVSDSVSRVSGRHATSGTLPYMSPQQLAGKRPSVADDIYALGATLYELLTSKPPFHTGDLTHQVLHEVPEPLDERLAGLDLANPVAADVSALIMACLAKDPGQRPQSARAVAEWVGLEITRKASVESLAEAMFPQGGSAPQSTPAELPTVAGSAPAAGKGRLALIVSAVTTAMLLAGAGAWYATGHRAGVEEHKPPARTAETSDAIGGKDGPRQPVTSINSQAETDQGRKLGQPWTNGLGMPSVAVPQGSSFKHWLGLEVGTDPETAWPLEAGNLLVDRGWPHYGDKIIQRARRSGLKLVMQFGRNQVALAETEGLSLARANRDVVIALAWAGPYYDGETPDDLSRFGQNLHKQVPGLQFWATFVAKPRGYYQTNPVPSAVDVLVMTQSFDGTPEAVERKAMDVLPRWIQKANGRPLLLQWCAWTGKSPGLIPSCKPGTMLKLADLLERYQLSGLVLGHYGVANGAKGLESNRALEQEVQQVFKRLE
jgi:Protein kinase domain